MRHPRPDALSAGNVGKQSHIDHHHSRNIMQPDALESFIAASQPARVQSSAYSWQALIETRCHHT